MDNLYQQMVQRCRTLVRKEAELAEECREFNRANPEILAEMEGVLILPKKRQLIPLIIFLRLRVGVKR